MSKNLVEIEGFEELEAKLKKLGNDKDKIKQVRQLLGQLANPTVKAAQRLAPKDKGIFVRGKRYSRVKRQVRKTVVQQNYTTGFAEKSIGKKMLTKARNPMLVVRSKDISIGGKKKYGGFYVRQFLIRGTKYIKANPFMDKAHMQTQGLVTKDAEKRMSRYIQRKIDKLS